MSRFPDLLDEQRRALFEIVEAFREQKMEGRAVAVFGPFLGDRQLLLSMGGPEESPRIDTDLDTLRVLDEAGYIALTETYGEWQDGSKFDIRTLTLKKFGVDYYDWARSSAVHRHLSGLWYSLTPFVLPALISSIFTLIVWMTLNWLFGGRPSILP